MRASVDLLRHSACKICIFPVSEGASTVYFCVFSFAADFTEYLMSDERARVVLCERAKLRNEARIVVKQRQKHIEVCMA